MFSAETGASVQGQACHDKTPVDKTSFEKKRLLLKPCGAFRHGVDTFFCRPGNKMQVRSDYHLPGRHQ